jgi:hypothetical protein
MLALHLLLNALRPSIVSSSAWSCWASVCRRDRCWRMGCFNLPVRKTILIPTWSELQIGFCMCPQSTMRRKAHRCTLRAPHGSKLVPSHICGDPLKSSCEGLVERDHHFAIAAFPVGESFLSAAESHESMVTEVCDVHHLRRLSPGLPPVGLSRGLNSLQDQTFRLISIRGEQCGLFGFTGLLTCQSQRASSARHTIPSRWRGQIRCSGGGQGWGERPSTQPLGLTKRPSG